MKAIITCIGSAVAFAIVAAGAQADEPYCREYTQPVNVGGKQQEGYGTACMQPDGSWQIIKPVEGDSMAQGTVVEEEYFTLPQPALSPVYYPSPVQTNFHLFYSNRDRGWNRGWRHGHSRGHHFYGHRGHGHRAHGDRGRHRH